MFPIKVGIMPFQIYKPALIPGASSQIPRGTNVMLATTWSNPRETKAKMGHQIPIILDARSRPCKPKKHPKQTSQLQPIPRRKIVWKLGVTCFFVAKLMTADLKGSLEKTSPSIYASQLRSEIETSVKHSQPKIIATMNREPAKFPKKVTTQWTSIFHQGSRRCKAATVVNYLIDKRSVGKWLRCNG